MALTAVPFGSGPQPERGLALFAARYNQAMTAIGKMMVVAGLALAGAGLLIWGLGRMGFRGLPGDIRYESEHVRVYFPIVTSIVLSLALTLLFWLAQILRRR